MTQPTPTPLQFLSTRLRRLHWMDWIGLSTLLMVTVLMFVRYAAGDGRRWAVMGLMALFAALLLDHDRFAAWPSGRHLRYALLTGLIVLLVALEANFNGVIVLFFILSAEALVMLPRRLGYAWVGLWGVATMALLVYLNGDLWLGVLNGLGVLGGYIFIGSAANAQHRAELAHTESQRLLAELQAAHWQLQEYATRAEELAIAQERNRLAREVHDTLGHRLTVAAVQLEGAQRLVQRDPGKAERIIETVRQQVVEGLGELRRTVAALRAPLEAELSLPHALMRLVANFQEATGVVAHLHLPETLPPIPDEQRHALYRTAQEALTNVQRHAAARTVWIDLRWGDRGSQRNDASNSEIQLCITDDGRGLPVDAATRGYGLRGLQERAEQLHGQFVMDSRSGGGTRVDVVLPLTSLDDASSDAISTAFASRHTAGAASSAPTENH